ncbi:carboxyl transferase domain-containing protein [Williamsia sp. CHRR-6]|uniref:carboxyl transferase domain-containing protein n=1 Tax=Williamsia sp. CHRR-6 TaxID=2835871 RepID=UPI001BDA073B|nr:carboxyl transferase domain-containing protein [Williamsia sp. CHRR-6]MBT0566469.1 acetyl-CoA carboxylase carboxyltransferase subunit alpha/beta [Williamsia sp. CHRR-6]
MTRRTARDILALLIDAESWRSWDGPPQMPAVISAEYAAELAAARTAAGVDESVLTGAATIAGRPVAIVVSEFGFLAGSIGRAAGHRIVAAIRRATAARLPLVALPASGGTRMQEGTAAFLQMVAITAAVVDHKAARLPYLVYLRHPTTGGVLASWGSLGHVTLAQPDALIGFLGPRVYEGLYGEPFAEGVQRAENLRAQGIIDIVTPPDNLAEFVDAVLAVVDHDRPVAPAAVATPSAFASRGEVWSSVLRSRDPRRPGIRDLLTQIASPVVYLNGTGEGESDRAMVVALATIGGRGVVVIGQDRRRQRPGSWLGPAALRVARRGMSLAAELNLPLVTVVDTPGAELSAAAEEGGLAAEIARCLADLIALPVPTVSVLLGEGAGGAALALLPADRLVAAEHAWLSPLPPEGASIIVHRDVDHAAQMAAAQGIRADTLRENGFVDLVVAEAPDSSAPEQFCAAMADAVVSALAQACAQTDRTQAIMTRTARFGA